MMRICQYILSSSFSSIPPLDFVFYSSMQYTKSLIYDVSEMDIIVSLKQLDNLDEEMGSVLLLVNLKVNLKWSGILIFYSGKVR